MAGSGRRDSGFIQAAQVNAFLRLKNPCGGALLSAACDVDPVSGVCRQETVTLLEPVNNTKVKGGGLECPPHTYLANSWETLLPLPGGWRVS
jgi:hypothetical protein